MVATQGGAGQWQRLPDSVQSTLCEAAETSQGRPAVVVGAIPFDENTAARLVVPECVQFSSSWRDILPSATPRPMANLSRERSVPEQDRYLESVRDAIAAIKSSKLRKVVLARSLELGIASPLDVGTLLHNLLQRNSAGYTFAVGVSECECHGQPGCLDCRRTLIGCKPGAFGFSLKSRRRVQARRRVRRAQR